MDKKSFFKGLVAGILVMVLCTGALRLVSVRRAGSSSGNTASMTMDQKIGTIANLLNKYYVEEVDFDKMEEGAYAGIVDSLGDPYTSYMPASQLKDFYDDINGSFYGIGVEVVMDPQSSTVLVVAPIENTPAYEAGIQPGDRIIKVNGADIRGKDINEIVGMIKGEEGTTVSVTVQRDSSGEILEMDLERGAVNVSSVRHEMLEDGIGYLRITQFNRNTYEQFMEAYNDLTQQGEKGLIIDLRNNPGGDFDVVKKIADELVPEGTLVYTIDKAGNREDTYSDAKCIQVPLCVLVNGYSASASEILSGAVQDLGAGKLVGTQTFGKGLVQGLYSLKDGSGIKITIQKYYTPKGVCIQGEGITPDYVVELPDTVTNVLHVGEEEDTQMQKAIEVIRAELGE